MSATPVIDIHAHIDVPAVDGLVQDQPGLAAEQAVQLATFGPESIRRNVELMTTSYRPLLDDLGTRLAQMDASGVDIHAISLVPTLYHYWADAPLANDIVAAPARATSCSAPTTHSTWASPTRWPASTRSPCRLPAAMR